MDLLKVITKNFNDTLPDEMIRHISSYIGSVKHNDFLLELRLRRSGFGYFFHNLDTKHEIEDIKEDINYYTKKSKKLKSEKKNTKYTKKINKLKMKLNKYQKKDLLRLSEFLELMSAALHLEQSTIYYLFLKKQFSVRHIRTFMEDYLEIMKREFYRSNSNSPINFLHVDYYSFIYYETKIHWLWIHDRIFIRYFSSDYVEFVNRWRCFFNLANF
jgi:hypothetical protein